MPLHVGTEKPAPFGGVFVLLQQVGKLDYFDGGYEEPLFDGWGGSVDVASDSEGVMGH